MNILEIIIKNEPSVKIRRQLERIFDYPEICHLLEKYYQDISSLKPVKKNQEIDKEKLKEIIFSTNHSVITEFNLIPDVNILFITCEILCRIRLILFEEFKDRGAALEKIRDDIILDSCTNTLPCENEFICLFIRMLHSKFTEKRFDESLQIYAGLTCLLWNGNEKQLKELEWRLNRTDWFTKHVVIRKLFNNNNADPILHCRSKRVSNVALLFRMLHKLNLIEANVGKSYVQIASRHIFCNEIQVEAHKLNKLSSEIMSNPHRYDHVMESVLKIVEAVKKA